MIAFAGAEPAVAADPEAPPIWITSPAGLRFRVRFDPGERLVVGTGIDATPQGTGPDVELGLWLRSEHPITGWEVYWKRTHEIVHVRLRPVAGSPAAIDAVLYRGLFLRQSREGTLTLPLSSPVAFVVPFDVGVLAEVGRLSGALWPEPGGASLDASVVHGEVVADFLRSPRPGRWLLVGVGGRYEVGLARDAGGTLLPDQRVSPMTALSLALHGERGDGLLAGGLRAEASRRWSSQRNWENALRIDGEAELTQLAVNDRPVSLFAAARADAGGGLPHPELRFVVGVRFSEPLTGRSPPLRSQRQTP